MKRPLLLLLAAASLAGGLAAFWWQDGDNRMPTRRTAATAPAAVFAAAPAASPASPENAAPAAESQSMAGLFQQDRDGHLLVTPDTLTALEIACTITPAETGEAPAGLSTSAWQEAVALTRRYCAYRKVAQAPQPIPDSPEALAQALQRQSILRQQYFDANTARLLFGNEEAHTHFSLAAITIRNDARLSVDEKERQLTALRQALPPEIAALETSVSRGDVLTDDARVQLARSARIQQEWEQRYEAFRAQKQIILASGLAEQDKAQQIETLLQQHYDKNELAAARAFDRSHTLAQ